MVNFRDLATRVDVTTRIAGLMSDTAFLLLVSSISAVSGLAQTAQEEVAGPGLRVESGLPGNDYEYLYN